MIKSLNCYKKQKTLSLYKNVECMPHRCYQCIYRTIAFSDDSETMMIRVRIFIFVCGRHASVLLWHTIGVRYDDATSRVRKA